MTVLVQQFRRQRREHVERWQKRPLLLDDTGES